jgi:hypothetical protein
MIKNFIDKVKIVIATFLVFFRKLNYRIMESEQNMKLNKLFGLFLLFSLSLVILSACQIPLINTVRGSGNVVSEVRDVEGFTKIQLDGIGNLYITQGGKESLEIQAEDNILPTLTSEIRGETLVLGFEKQNWSRNVIPTEGINYYLNVIDLEEITFNGLGDMEAQNLTTSNLTIEIIGAGNINIADLNANQLTIKISGAGSIEINGEVDSQKVTIDGTGGYKAANLKTRSTIIDINGLGNSTIWATDILDISVDGGGSIDYYGSPSITQEINGLGDITSLGEK